MRTWARSAAIAAGRTSLPHPKSMPLKSQISAAFDCAAILFQLQTALAGSASVRSLPRKLSPSGSKKRPMATKMLPKSTRKALGRKGFKIGKYWYGYQDATSGTFRNEKRRFFALSSGISKLFQPVRGVTQGSDGRKGCEISQYGRKSRTWHRILAKKPGSQI